ncbi:MAG: B12-binding domain-containing radical SAM protein, partial [Desulfobacteraceae bacterium]|nr:B12-binding domain-containing radical SAM protein [Desulfobacteraceae bacterium]
LQEGFLHLEPLELEITAAGIDQKHETRIIDLSVKKNPRKLFFKILEDYKPDLIGFSAYSTAVHLVKDLAKKTKQTLPQSHIIIGGIHATLRPYDFNYDFISAIVRGEGANAISNIIKSIETGTKISNNTNILSPADPDFELNSKSDPPPYVKVSSIPLPRRDLVDRSKYFCIWTHTDTGRIDNMFPQVATLRTSVGCPFSCSFCVIHHVMNRAYLQRTPEDVVDEIENLKEDYIYFVDDEMFINVKRVTKIAHLLKERNIKKKYISWARSDTICRHPEVFKLWKEVGLDVVYVGLESMDQERLKEYNKKTGYETNKKAIKILKFYGIMLHAAFIVHPDFDKQDFKSLEQDVIDLCPSEVSFTVLSPSPGTQLFKDHKHEFICNPFKYYDCMHTVIPTNMKLKRFYQHFGRLYSIALRHNPLRMNRIRVKPKDFFRAFIVGTKYIFSLYSIYKDYPKEMHQLQDKKLLEASKKTGFSSYDN